ncbi:transposase, IS4-like family protein [Streptococcus sp. AS20]|nr:transposase, IS4-like family protein [Streptococcus sp. AS20]
MKVHLAVTVSSYILDYLVTLASVHDIQVAEELLETVLCSRVLGDLGYLSKELKERLEAKGVHLWTPLRKNMESADEHNNPAF